MTTEESVAVLPHSYDGIQEFDNRLPNWWLMTLFGAILFGAAYWIYYEGASVGATAMEEFEAEQAAAKVMAEAREKEQELKNPITDEYFAALANDPETLHEGKEVWTANCVACHSADGQGLVGPNLTDAYWIHGANNKAIYSIVAEGVAAKGMPAWTPVLGATKVKQVTAFVVAMKGKNLVGKAPQGVDAEGNPPPSAEQAQK